MDQGCSSDVGAETVKWNVLQSQLLKVETEINSYRVGVDSGTGWSAQSQVIFAN